MSIPISLICLHGNEGFLLAEPIYNRLGQILYSADRVLDKGTIEQLKKYFLKNSHDIQGITIKVKFDFNHLTVEQQQLIESIQEQNSDIPNLIKTELHSKTLEALKSTYITTNTNIKDALKIVDECISDLATLVQETSNFSYSLGQYKNQLTAVNVFEHSLRVAQFSVVLANLYNQKIGFSNERIDLKSIGTAALLHDYGVCFRDKMDMKKLSLYQLSDNFLKNHPTIPADLLQQPYNPKYKNVYAYSALKNFLDNSTLATILLSGESENGRGINCLNIVNNKTNGASMAAKIIFLCNLYDSLLSRTIEKDESLENVSTTLEMLIKNGAINTDIGNLFLDNIPLYSIGVRVMLSTGEYATVIERFKGKDAAKPVVKTLVNPPLQSRTIDLRTATNITILKIVGSNEILDVKIKEITDHQIKTMGITTFPFEYNQTTSNIHTNAIDELERPKAI